MNKQEFLDVLGQALKRGMTDGEVAENVRYYDAYIEQEKAGGQGEEQVISELGDPRLIARTILQVDQKKEESVFGQSVYTEDPKGGYAEDTYGDNPDLHHRSPFGKVKTFDLGGAKFWIILILILIVLFAVLRTAFVIVWKLLPILLMAGLVMWVYHNFFEKK